MHGNLKATRVPPFIPVMCLFNPAVSGLTLNFLHACRDLFMLGRGATRLTDPTQL